MNKRMDLFIKRTVSFIKRMHRYGLVALNLRLRKGNFCDNSDCCITARTECYL